MVSASPRFPVRLLVERSLQVKQGSWGAEAKAPAVALVGHVSGISELIRIVKETGASAAPDNKPFFLAGQLGSQGKA